MCVYVYVYVSVHRGYVEHTRVDEDGHVWICSCRKKALLCCVCPFSLPAARPLLRGELTPLAVVFVYVVRRFTGVGGGGLLCGSCEGGRVGCCTVGAPLPPLQRACAGRRAW